MSEGLQGRTDRTEPRSLFAPSSAEHRDDRPVMTREQITQLTKRILMMSSLDTARVDATHTARTVTRISNDRVRTRDDGDDVHIWVNLQEGGRAGVTVKTNQLSESTLRAIVARCETLARNQHGSSEQLLHAKQQQDTYPSVALWHDTTVRAMTTSRENIGPTLIDGVTKHGLRTAGFVGLMARAQAMVTKEGIEAFCDETDCEVTVTARTPDYTSSGWAGQAARDWNTMDCAKIAEDAAQLALQGRNAQAIEPGRRTAILGPAAVVQMMRYFAQEYDAFATDIGRTGFSKPSGGNRLGQRVFDPRISMSSDPADPDGGYLNFFYIGHANPKMSWVENGVLKNLAYNPEYAMSRGKSYADDPHSLRISGGTSSIESMIAACKEGVYVNRFSDVSLIDLQSGVMTGVTANGCFLVKDGKINRPIKDLRFLESPFFMLNRLDALGPTVRAPFGYTPPDGSTEYGSTMYYEWPRRPMIVPSMMVRDFNFTALASAV